MEKGRLFEADSPGDAIKAARANTNVRQLCVDRLQMLGSKTVTHQFFFPEVAPKTDLNVRSLKPNSGP